MIQPPERIELCLRAFNGGSCLGVLYRPQPDLVVCARCGGKDPGAVYRLVVEGEA